MTNTIASNQPDRRGRSIRPLVRRHALANERGQSFVEIALVMPIFVLLLVGAAEFGRMAFTAIEVSNAARAGAQYGAQSHITASDTAGMTTAATNDAGNITGTCATTGLCVTATQFCACSSAPSAQVSCTTVLTSCSPAPLHSLEYVQVNTSAVVTPPFHLRGLPTSYTLHGQAIMRVEQ